MAQASMVARLTGQSATAKPSDDRSEMRKCNSRLKIFVQIGRTQLHFGLRRFTFFCEAGISQRQE